LRMVINKRSTFNAELSTLNDHGKERGRPESGAAHRARLKSLSENCAGRCGEGFWLWPRRRGCFHTGNRIPAAGCNDRANASHGQKNRRPDGFRGKDRLALLLLSRRSTGDILLRRASPSGLSFENIAARNFQTGSRIERQIQVGFFLHPVDGMQHEFSGILQAELLLDAGTE